MDIYRNRLDAGVQLGKQLTVYANRDDVIVLALPRGGVPVAFEIAKLLHLPLDIFIVRKLGVPGHSELAMGAIATNDTIVFNEDIIADLSIEKPAIEQVIMDEKQELKRREKVYRGSRPFPSLKNKTILLVDDGIATGATMRVAIKALRQSQPAAIVVAVPVAEKRIVTQLTALVDDLICPLQPTEFNAVGAWYEDFSQTEDEEVHALLQLK